MNEAEAIYTVVIGCGALAVVIAPIMKLNASIVKLNANFENMLEHDKIRDNRINKHGQEIDELGERLHDAEHELSNHETRIKSLETTRNGGKENG
ncbi:hypothetical protein MKC49_04335 [[Clostridium] innocuum]|nr:hypothetical protein [[Clostridium] innocuum]MCR0466815.1 hypothetical protein [[Clostridium] innocuum]MCR0475262.1 hypothetical protein [[Clostridium] innocuum]